MKKFLLLIAFVPFLLFYDSCTKDKTNAPVACTPTDTVNTYTKSVKSIFDTYCAISPCHDAATASVGVRMDTYANAKDAAKNQPKFFCAIDQTCSPAMPYTPYPPLADSLIAKIQAWKNNCYAQ